MFKAIPKRFYWNSQQVDIGVRIGYQLPYGHILIFPGVLMVSVWRGFSKLVQTSSCISIAPYADALCQLGY